MRYVTNARDELIAISRSGEIVVQDDNGRERERHKVPYGATLNIKPDQTIKAGTVLANWDPLTRPIITEFAGKAKFENVEEGLTVAKQVDEVTGLSTLVVIDPKRRGAAKVVRPQVKLIDAQGNEVKIPGTDHSVTIGFQVGALIQVRDGQEVGPGEVLARIPVGSVVSFMLPNWHEAAIVYHAATLAGMVVNPILPSLRDHELGFILTDADVRMMFVPGEFGVILGGELALDANLALGATLAVSRDPTFGTAQQMALRLSYRF